MAISIDDPARLEGSEVMGSDGKKLGSVDALYYDNTTHDPTWAAVKTGLFGTHVSLVPLARASYENQALTVPYDKDALKSAPHHDPGRELSPREEEDLFRHYGMAGRPGAQGMAPQARDAEAAMTRSEERLRVGTETHEMGQARLRRRVVTEHQTVEVPVSHEEVHIEREPITDANRRGVRDGDSIAEGEHEVTLHAERAVVAKETVPVEQVRLRTETVRGTEKVDTDLRHEEIDVEDGRRKQDRR